jgi:4-alpha-glucanotransferase
MRGLFASESWMAIYMITDLFGTAQRFNVPGAVSDSNWSQRLYRPIAQWRQDPELVSKMESIRDIIHATGRV